ncbi:MAG: Hsp20/alpha crystallin family protein [Planctomycetaceae bacterium]|nr:Hsp20/alpha crystallin family protein [Planctomycetaceae bacterium]
MPVFRWGNAWDAFRDLEREVDRLMGSMDFTLQGVRLGRTFPAVNLYEYDDHYLLTSELPGMKKSDLDLSIAQGILTLKGNRTADDVPDSSYRRSERYRGQWQRSLNLPDRVMEEGLKAELTNGILKITLPKAPEVTPRQIPIQEGGE